MTKHDNTNEFYATRHEADKAVDRWIGRGYVGTGRCYNPEFAEQEGHPDQPHVVIILDDHPQSN